MNGLNGERESRPRRSRVWGFAGRRDTLVCRVVNKRSEPPALVVRIGLGGAKSMQMSAHSQERATRDSAPLPRTAPDSRLALGVLCGRRNIIQSPSSSSSHSSGFSVSRSGTNSGSSSSQSSGWPYSEQGWCKEHPRPSCLASWLETLASSTQSAGLLSWASSISARRLTDRLSSQEENRQRLFVVNKDLEGLVRGDNEGVEHSILANCQHGCWLESCSPVTGCSYK